MQLNQPIPPAASDGQNPYDFILSGNQQPKQGRIFKSGGSKKQRLILVIGGGLALFAIFGIILLLIFSSGSSDLDKTLAIAQSQNEIIRISQDGQKNARSYKTQTFNETVNITITSAQNETIAYLSKNRKKPKEKTLAATANAKTTNDLKSALQAGRYDEFLTATLIKSLQSYQGQLNDTYQATGNPALKKLLKQQFDQSVILLKNQEVTNS